MNTTMDFKNGELPIKPVSWFLNMPFSGTTVNARMMAITINVPVAAHSAFFGWTNIGQVIAVKGAALLNSIDMPSGLLFLGFILICAFINLMIGSASAQWAVTAPIFVPMLMLAGYAPETIQAAYRIGDSVTNIITPMMSYFGLILAVATKYKKDTGIGTMISMMLPYSIIFLIGWSLLFYLWVFVFHLPVGPGSPIYYSPHAG